MVDRYPEFAGGINQPGIETARIPIIRTHLRITLVHRTHGGQHDFGREWKRCQWRPPREGSIVRTIGHPARCVPEQPSRAIACVRHPGGRAITCSQAPAIFVIPDEFARVTSNVLALNEDRVPTVLEIIAALLMHERVSDATKIDPCMRELMNEQRPGVQEIDVVEVFPLVGGRPCFVGVWPGRVRW